MTDLSIDVPAGSPIMTMTRTFDAPAALVLKCLITPELIEQWWGPRQMVTKVDHLDARNGGTWRFINITPDGTEYGFHGVFHNDPSVADGVIQTWEWEGMPGQASLGKMTLREEGGRTILSNTAVYLSVEDRDQHIQNGMEHGMRESYERLDEVLARGA